MSSRQPKPFEVEASCSHTTLQKSDTFQTESDSNSWDVENGSFSQDDDASNDHNIGMHPEVDQLGSARTPWYGTSMVLLAEVLGTGVLSLPYAAKTLGFASSAVFLVVFAFFSYYASVMLSSVRQKYPHVRSYADAATELFGPRFGKFTSACMLLNWGGVAIYFLVAGSDAMGTISNEGWFACKINRTLMAGLFFVVACQVRDFHAVSKYLAGPSFLAIITALLLILVTLLINERHDFGSTTTIGPGDDTDALSYLRALSSIVFAYQGQSIFLELMAEMKDSKQFPKATLVSYIIMLATYSATVVIAYGVKGQDVPDFLPDVLHAGSVPAQIVGVLTFFHIMVTYVVVVQPIHVWIHTTFRHKTLYKNTFAGTCDWMIITVSFAVFAWIIANLVPFFADIQSILGSLFGAPTIFGWPVLFYFRAHRREAKSLRETIRLMGVSDTVLCVIMFCVLLPLFAIVGTSGGVVTLLQDIENGGTAFGC